MSYLSAGEAAAAVADVRALIESTGETAQLFAATHTPSGSFAGDKPTPLDVMGIQVAVLAQDKQPADLLQVDHDYVLSLLSEVTVSEGDELTFRGARFVVVDIQVLNLFGTVTHRNVAVKKQRGT